MKNLILKSLNNTLEFSKFNNLTDYIRYKGYRLSFVETNIYTLLKYDSNGLYQNFLREGNSEHHARIKFLADCFLTTPIKTVFSLYENDVQFFLSKGYKKVLACAVDQIHHHPILIVSKNIYGNEISCDEELYKVLKRLDNHAATFQIEFNTINNIPNIHFCENTLTLRNYFNYDLVKNLHSKNKLDTAKAILLVNNAQTFDKRIISKHIVTTEVDIIKLAYQYPMYDTIVLGIEPIEITLEYLEFVRINLHKNQKNKVGIGKKVIIYNRFLDGHYNNISDSPMPARNGNNLIRYV